MSIATDFDAALNCSSAELFALRARTFLERLLVAQARYLGLDKGKGFWATVREVFSDEQFAEVRTNIQTVSKLRNVVAHELHSEIPLECVLACKGAAKVPELETLLALADEFSRIETSTSTGDELREQITESVVSIAIFETMAQAFVAILQQRAASGAISFVSVEAVRQELRHYATQRRKFLRTGCSYAHRALAFARMRGRFMKRTTRSM